MDNIVNSLITKLKKGQLSVYEIPTEYANNRDVIREERRLGLRIIGRRGYDIIRDKFFVEEKLIRDRERIWFDDFKSFYDFVDGNIYDNSCYYQIDPNKIDLEIDFKKLLANNCFVENTITDDLPVLSEEDLQAYEEGEKRKKQFKEWLEKINCSKTPEEFSDIASQFKKSEFLAELVELSSNSKTLPSKLMYQKKYGNCIIWSYVYRNMNNLDSFKSIMPYASCYSLNDTPVRELCTVYNPSDIANAYNFQNGGSSQANYKQNKRIKDFAKAIENNLIRFVGKKCYFDKLTHYFWEETLFEILPGSYTNNQGMARYFVTYRLFESFDEFADYRKGDLSNCDLSGFITSDVDFSAYKTNDKTKLPIVNNYDIECVIKKVYSLPEDCYIVRKQWTRNGILLQQKDYKFYYFFDFVAFLKGDLTKADLISCKGLLNLRDISGIDLTGAYLTSDVCSKFNIAYDIYSTDNKVEESELDFALENEKTNEIDSVKQDNIILLERNEMDVPYISFRDNIIERIYYISDIHFHHLFQHHNVKSKEDCIFVLRKVAYTISKESKQYRYILITGDLSMDFLLFKQFAYTLHESIESEKRVIFVIGNHDIWSCPYMTFDELTDNYRSMLSEINMFLLQNDVLYATDNNVLKHISENELFNSSVEELKERTRDARIIFFGGTGFAGYNSVYNASYGLYRYNNTILFNRSIELDESQKFDYLYNKICSSFQEKNVVVATHMPLNDWHFNAERILNFEEKEKMDLYLEMPSLDEYQPGFVYVSGHTHRNYYYDDGDIRIYSDNQFGYNNTTPGAMPHLKFFEINNSYDWFSYKHDGVYEITNDDYRKFYLGKNIQMTFTHETDRLFMLKKNGYYCFMQKSKHNDLSILNGGTPKALDNNDIDFYYENMEKVIKTIKSPLEKFTDYQCEISNVIKSFGGSGKIHGCIIDIDYFCHIFVNPIDGKTSAYWASDIIHKLIYNNVPSLLKEHCPLLYARYTALSKEEKNNLAIIAKNEEKKNSNISQIYLDTDIYRASREIRKMQKLDYNILTTWPNEFEGTKKLKEK